MSESAKPRGPFAVESVAWAPWSQGVRYGGKVRVLSDTRTPASRLKIGVAIEELPPGKQSCVFHYHLLEEEHIWILSGSATLRLGEERYTVTAGDFVSFPAGARDGHCLINETEAPCSFLIIGDNDPNEVCVYPDSNKIMVRALGRQGMEDIFDAAATRDYWHGELGDD
jgi:uncharacterized cupin superfamily protein